MMLYPEVEKISDMIGNAYALCNIISKRAKQIEHDNPALIDASSEKAISLAAREVLAGKVVASTN